MSECIFCKIVAGEVPSSNVYEDDQVLAFRDINPEAPVHILAIPKKHIAGLKDVSPEDRALIGHIMTVLKEIARDEGIEDSGYRVLTNCGPDSGQIVDHLHFHLLGGRQLGKIG